MSDDRFRVHLDVALGADARPPVPEPDAPFRVAILGDFGGRARRASDDRSRPVAERRPLLVDRDNFDEVLARVAPTVRLDDWPGSADGERVTVSFRELDDFHPDALFERSPAFAALRDLRARVADPARYREVARAVGLAVPPAASSPPVSAAPSHAPAAPVTELGSGSLLDQILAGTAAPLDAPVAQTAPPARAPSGDPLADFLRQAVAPSLVRGAEPPQAELLADVDRLVEQQMRAVLHHPSVQALEALWRAVFVMVRRVETSGRLQLYLIDLTWDELVDELRGDGDGRASGVRRLLAGADGDDAARWAVLVGAFDVGASDAALPTLRRAAALARSLGAPWLFAAHPSLLGAPSLHGASDLADWGGEASPEWSAFRRAPDARWLGLALPRWLLRLPYGEDTEPCERLRFEEVDAPPAHEHYLWGNPAVACAMLLAQAFAEDGWRMRPGAHLDIDRMPLHLVRTSSGTTATPPAEVTLGEGAVDRLLDAGLIPLVSRADADVVRVVRLQSVADPPAPLAGRWGG